MSGGGGGALVLVATPIGNLGDLSPRAVDALSSADVVCCEDTRRTRALLSAAGVPAGGRLRSLHAHNEAARIPEILSALSTGKTVVVVTDAGTPGVSDPGMRLVEAAVREGATVTTVPGPSSVLAALVVSGLPTDRFCVEGFLPRSGGERWRRLDALVAAGRTTVVLESPRRLPATLGDLAVRVPDRPVAVCRELTKAHEEVWRGSAADAAEEFARRAGRGELRGEVVVVVAGAATAGGRARGPGSDADDRAVAEAAARRVAAGDSTRDAADAVARELGVSRRRAYAAAVSVAAAGPSTRRARRAGQTR